MGLLAVAGLLGVYLALPEGEDAYAPQPIPSPHDGSESQKLTINELIPNDPDAGSALMIGYSGGEPGSVHAWLGKSQLDILARRPGSLVVQLPQDLPPGRARLRLVAADEHSHWHELHIKAINWRKPFRNLCGGLALLVLGVQMLSRGARGVLDLPRARRLKALTGSRWLVMGLGLGAGALTQSTTAVAGLLAGLVGSRVLAELPAAAAFLGAQLGAALVPLALASVSEPRWGLTAIAVGALMTGLASDRRSKAFARILLGAGLIAFGVQVLRPGFEPFVSNRWVLAAIDRFPSHGWLASAGLVLVGALLVALFQGPAPVLILAFGIAEMTGHSNLHQTLMLLSGAGLGAGMAALLAEPQGSSLARLNLLAGAGSTLIMALLVHGLARGSVHWVAGYSHPIWNGRHRLPDMSWTVAVSFAIAQLLAAVVMVAILPWLTSFVRRAGRTPALAPRSAPATAAVRREISQVLQAQRAALPELLSLALHGERAAGREAEQSLLDARMALRHLFAGPVLELPETLVGGDLGRIAVTCRQLQRSFEVLLEQAERLTENRITWSESNADVPALSEQEQAVLREMHNLITDGLSSFMAHLSAGSSPNSDETRAREIRLNATESRTRHALLAERSDRRTVQLSLSVIEVIDAYEVTGNQLYRLAETLSEAHSIEASNPLIALAADPDSVR